MIEIKLLNGKVIGDSSPCFIVAEIGNNHQGDFELAVKLIEEAKKAGVDAVKFQKRDIKSLLTKELYNLPYQGENSFGSTYGEHREKLELSIEEFAKLKEIAEKNGLLFFASAWDFKSLYELNKIGVEIIKICSADLVNIPFLREIAKLNKIVFLSSGMSTIDQIDKAVDELKKFDTDFVLLHCNSSYPCDYKEIAIPVIKLLRNRYQILVGYSGHEIGIYPSIAAICLGACVLERHFTLNKSFTGTDHRLSLTPSEMKELVNAVRIVEDTMCIKEKKLFKKEIIVSQKLRKSIVASRDIKKGEILTQDNLTVKCPGNGMSPEFWYDIMGKRAARDFKKDDFIFLEDLI